MSTSATGEDTTHRDTVAVRPAHNRHATRQQTLFFGFFYGGVLLALLAHARVYFWLCDDAYISFRYVRNLVNGHGLVYNLGEYVEGYTNFLWVLHLAALWKLAGINPEIGSVLLSAAYTLGVLALALALLRENLLSPTGRWLGLGVLFLLVINRSFALFCSSGLETRQFTFFLLLAVVLASRARSARGLVGASLAMGAAELSRPEGLMVWGVICLWFVLDRLANESLHRKPLAAIVVPAALIIAGHFLFRRWYYGDWFPNTYYAKIVRPWPDAGFQYAAMFIAEHGLYLSAVFVAIAIARRLKHGDSSGVLMAALMLSNLAYIVRIGGDHFEFRVFDYWWPMLAVLTVEGVQSVVGAVQRRLPEYRDDRGVSILLTATFLIIVSLYSTVLQIGKYCTTYEADGSRYIVPRIDEKTFPIHRLLPGMKPIAEMYNASAEFCVTRHICAPQRMHYLGWIERSAMWRPYEEFIGTGLFPQDAVMSTRAAGIGPYFLADLTVIDELGLTDAIIARAPVDIPNSKRRLAHDRTAPKGYLESRGVNFFPLPLVNALPPPDTVTADTYYLQLRDNLYMPFRSPDPDWVARRFPNAIHLRAAEKKPAQ